MRNRSNRVVVCLSDEELSAINEKVKKSGLSRSTFLRRMMREIIVREAPPADIPTLIWEIRRLGNNINQILKIANSQNLLDVPQLRKVIDECYTAIQLIISTYSKSEG